MAEKKAEAKEAAKPDKKEAEAKKPVEKKAQAKAEKSKEEKKSEAKVEKKTEKKAEKKAGKKAEKEKPKGEERVYTISLRKAFDKPRTKRRKRAVSLIREFISKHMKAVAVKIDNAVNALIWKQNKPPRKVKVKAVKDKDGVAKVLKA